MKSYSRSIEKKRNEEDIFNYIYESYRTTYLPSPSVGISNFSIDYLFLDDIYSFQSRTGLFGLCGKKMQNILSFISSNKDRENLVNYIKNDIDTIDLALSNAMKEGVKFESSHLSRELSDEALIKTLNIYLDTKPDFRNAIYRVKRLSTKLKQLEIKSLSFSL